MLKKGRFLFLIVAIIEIAMYFIPVSSEVFAVYKEENMLKENNIEVTSEESEKETNEVKNEIENNETNENEINSSVQANYNSNKTKNIAGELVKTPEDYGYEKDESYNITESTCNESAEALSNQEFLVGHYQLNYTGGTAVARGGNYGNDKLYKTDNVDNFSKLSRLGGEYEFLSAFEKDTTSNDVTIHGNSSGGLLKQQNSNDSIYKAYLVISQKNNASGVNKSGYHLENCPITLVGPNNGYIETKMEHIENNKTTLTNRYVGYMDITNFVKEQGYGWYYCCNIPYQANSAVTDDQYASWRLIIIEENKDLPLRALSLKIGTAGLAGGNSLSVEINKAGIKGLAENSITGQLLYSVDGADLDKENKFSLIIDEDKESHQDIALYSSSSGTWDTSIRNADSSVLKYVFTRNGKRIDCKTEFGESVKSAESNINNYMGADADLIDIADGNPITITNSAESFKFKFTTKSGHNLQPTALGLVIDIEGTDYETKIETENVKNEDYAVDGELNDNKILVKGSASNIKGNNETGLYDTKTLIKLDEKIKNIENAQIKATYIENNAQNEGVEISSEKIETDKTQNTISISWGKQTTYDPNAKNIAKVSNPLNKAAGTQTINDLTLYGDKMTFEISGLEVEDGADVSQCVNTVEVTGKIYASGVPVNTELEMAPTESKVVYEDITIDEIWKDDGYAENRPESIKVDIYDKTDIDAIKELVKKNPALALTLKPIRTFTLSADDVDSSDVNKWTETLKLAAEEYEGSESTKKYNYVISKSYNYEAKNGDKYVSDVQVAGGELVDIDEYIKTNPDYAWVAGMVKNIAIVKDKEEDNNLTLTTTNVLTGKRDVTVNKIWEDYNNIRNLRPDAIKVELLANNESMVEGNYKVTLNSTNKVENDESKWSTKFEGLDKYDKDGKVIEYTAKEFASDDAETIENYSGQVELDYDIATDKKAYIDSNENTITIKNSYAELLNPEFTNTITKIADVKKSGTNSEIIYEIKFNATIDDFIGDANVIIVDELPFTSKNIEKLSEVDKNGNVLSTDKLIGNELFYNTINNTVTWIIENNDIMKLLGQENVINTYKNGEAKIEITKYLKVNYKDIDIDEEQIENKATGTLALKVKEDGTNISTQKESSAEANATTELKKATLVVKYVNGETGEELAKSDIKDVFVNDEYEVEAKEIEDYELVTPVPANKKGTIKEGENEVIFYYRKKTFNVNAKIINGQVKVTKGQEEVDDNVNVIIHENAKVTFEPDEGYYVSKIFINGVEQDRAGNEKGGIIELKDIKENYNIVILCEKIRGTIIIDYVDENGYSISDSDVIEAYVGEKYSFEAKEIDGYRYIKTEGKEEGVIQEGIAFVTYYYSKVEEIQVTGEKDKTPKTGEETNMINIVAVITMLSIAGIITIKKKIQ